MKMKMILLTTLMLLFCIGCGNTDAQDPKPIATAIVVSNHANAPAINLENNIILTEKLYDTTYSIGQLTAITADGEPNNFISETIPPFPKDGLSENKKNEISLQRAASLKEMISLGMNAKVEEVDTLLAIQTGAIWLENIGDAYKKELLILNSGLSTDGTIKITEELLSVDSNSVVEELANLSELPNLEGVDVYWSMLGKTAFPQEPLDYSQLKNLENFWYTILIEAGANSVTFTNETSIDETIENLPAVTTIDFNTDSLKPFKTVTLDATTLQFVGNTAKFVDPTSANATLADVAQLLENHNAYIVGSTASGTADFCKDLSTARAQAVTDVLRELGVQSELTILALGFDSPWHVDDLDSSGNLIEEMALQNRTVRIIDKNSPDADQLHIYL